MTIEERIKKIKKDIEELGILSIHCDGFNKEGNLEEIIPNIEATEQIIKIIREHNNKHPSEWESKCIELIEKVREEAWKHKNHEKYFEEMEKYFWWFHKAGYDIDEAYRLTLEKFNPNLYQWN
jgi:hypothetical protein